VGDESLQNGIQQHPCPSPTLAQLLFPKTIGDNPSA